MELTVPSKEHFDNSRKLVLVVIASMVLMYLGWRIMQGASHSIQTHHSATQSSHTTEIEHGEQAHHTSPPPAMFSVVPFICLLLAIACLPLLSKTEHWWEQNQNRFLVAVGLGVCSLSYYVFLYGHGVVDHSSHELSEPGLAAAVTVVKNAILVEYIPFIVLLFSLYVISGGISIEGKLVGTPRLNSSIIGIGGLLASFIGTTGAAMLLIRPLLKANRHRDSVAHTVIFFIFVVCNTGGCLLPIGDPPLFLGYLRGVEFTWTLSLWPMWLFMNLSLITVYFVWDALRFRNEDKEKLHSDESTSNSRFAIRGCANFLWLGGVIGCVALLDPSKPFPGTLWHAPKFYREIAMLGLTALSLWSTSSVIRKRNAFNYDAIIEVAALFIGIFICMQAPVQILNTYGSQLGFDSPTKFFWGTGILSSFLDNAPTYVVFFETAKTMETAGETMAGVWLPYLAAVSLGSVFMGAMTYIGNGPNFMVKAIAEAQNVKMPSFFGYMLYSCAVLFPLAILMNLLFL